MKSMFPLIATLTSVVFESFGEAEELLNSLPTEEARFRRQQGNNQQGELLVGDLPVEIKIMQNVAYHDENGNEVVTDISVPRTVKVVRWTRVVHNLFAKDDSYWSFVGDESWLNRPEVKALQLRIGVKPHLSKPARA